MALKRNLDVRIERLSSEIARFNLAGAYGAYDPILTIQASHEYLDTPGNFSPEKHNVDFPYTMDVDQGRGGLTGMTPFGMNYSLDAGGGRKTALTDFNGRPDDAEGFPGGIRDTNNSFASAGLTLRQHLLKDFWIDQSREVVQVRRAELKMSEAALRMRILETMLAVELTYYDLAAGQELVRVQEMALRLKQQFVAETKRRVEVGDQPRLDLQQAETQLENTLTALAAAREAWMSEQNALKGLVSDNLQEWAEDQLAPAEIPAVSPPRARLSESFQHALRERPDLLEARLMVDRSDVVVRFRYNQLFPSLDLVGRVGSTGVDANFGDAAGSALRKGDPDYMYGIVVSMPLTRTAQRNDYRMSKSAKEMAKLQLQKAEQAVLLQVADWVNRVESRFSQVGSTAKARAYAEAALAAEQKKLENGLTTPYFVLEFQDMLTAARRAEALALADYHKAQAQLAFAEGSTLDRYHMAVEVR
jgi:outer membrane protein TolC